MPRERPGAVTVAAVLCIIYGSLWTACGLFSVSNMATKGAHGARGEDFIQDLLNQEVPGYQIVQIVREIVSMAVALTLLGGGIGLLSMRRWARKVALAGCTVGIIYVLSSAIYHVTLVFPVMNKAAHAGRAAAMNPDEDVPPNDGQAMVVNEAARFVAVGLAALVIAALVSYLMLIILLLSRRRVREAFAGMAQVRRKT